MVEISSIICPGIGEKSSWNSQIIAVATIEADEAIASSDFLKIMGISPKKRASWGDSGQFWSFRLVWF